MHISGIEKLTTFFNFSSLIIVLSSLFNSIFLAFLVIFIANIAISPSVNDSTIDNPLIYSYIKIQPTSIYIIIIAIGFLYDNSFLWYHIKDNKKNSIGKTIYIKNGDKLSNIFTKTAVKINKSVVNK